ncbi:MAG: restriction endonuclease subunit S, partial [Proteobacteria bacterium]|nr:restriction endonuclease subunit S [Pseudomonadota bacterium]
KVVPSLEINCAYIGLENLKTGGGLADIGKSNKVKSLKTVFRSGDVLYGKLRPYLNKHTKVDFDGITSTDILVFRTKGVLSEELLDMYLGVPRVVDYANRNSKGINLPRVSPKVMMRLLIPVPPPDEQKEIVRILDKLLDHEDEAKALIDMAEEIDLLEKSILSKAFRGELGTNDPNDEPAIELLKRSLKEKMNK